MNSQQNNHEVLKQPQVTGNIAMYARAAEKLHPNVKPQTADLLSLAQQLGLSNEQIIMFDQDNDTPSTTHIVKRQGLRELVTELENGTIQIVIVSDGTRLNVLNEM